jgi:hypothetical protein
MHIRWLDEIEDFRFDVTHLPGTRNLTDPLTRRGFADGPWRVASTALARSELDLGTGTTSAPTPQVLSDAHFLAQGFVRDLVPELAADVFFGPIVRGAAAMLGKPVDLHCVANLDCHARRLGGEFLVRCGQPYRRGQGSADRLCIPAGGGLRTEVLRECHDGPTEGHFGRAKTGSLVHSLAFWVGQDSIWSSMMSASARPANG